LSNENQAAVELPRRLFSFVLTGRLSILSLSYYEIAGIVMALGLFVLLIRFA
jgi:hypothetical protein